MPAEFLGRSGAPSSLRNPAHPATWRAVVKIDPARRLDPARLAIVAEARPDGVIVGGTQDIEAGAVAALLKTLQPLRGSGVPLAYEPSELFAVDPLLFDWLLVPVVLNAGDVEWLVRRHARAAQAFAPLVDLLNWSRVVPEAYIVQNPASAVARRTGATPLGPAEAAALAVVAERLWSFPIVYLEWSGRYGDAALVRAVAARLRQARLFYGGGIISPEQALAMRAAGAATIVVGNLVYSAQVQRLPAILDAARHEPAPL
jgi:geranylgeranylglyceryl phosphate synthase family protein